MTTTIPNPFELDPPVGPLCILCTSERTGDGDFYVLDIESRAQLREYLRAEYTERGLDSGPKCSNCGMVMVVDEPHDDIMSSIARRDAADVVKAAIARADEAATVTRKPAGGASS